MCIEVYSIFLPIIATVMAYRFVKNRNLEIKNLRKITRYINDKKDRYITLTKGCSQKTKMFLIFAKEHFGLSQEEIGKLSIELIFEKIKFKYDHIHSLITFGEYKYMNLNEIQLSFNHAQILYKNALNASKILASEFPDPKKIILPPELESLNRSLLKKIG